MNDEQPARDVGTNGAPKALPGKDGWEKTKIVVEIVQKIALPIVVLLLGFWIKDSVEIALKKQELEISSAQGMEDLIGTLRKPNLEGFQADGAALALSTYGRHAITPLILILSEGSNARSAAEKSLFAIGLAHQETTCQLLRRVLSSRNGEFPYRTHESVIDLLRRIGCRDDETLAALEDYKKLVDDRSGEGFRRYTEILSDTSIDREAMGTISKKVDKTIEVLKQQ